jgi:hypothetical protein
MTYKSSVEHAILHISSLPTTSYFSIAKMKLSPAAAAVTAVTTVKQQNGHYSQDFHNSQITYFQPPTVNFRF